MFIKIEKILYHSLKKSGIQNKIEEQQLVEVAAEVIADIVGAQALHKIKALRLENQTLYLACLSDLLTHRIKQFEKKILWELNSPFHRPMVKKIAFEV